MERAPQFSSNLSHSYSMPSLADGSEPISEAEELQEVKSLKDRGDEAMQIHDYSDAINYYNEALEIDDKNVDVLLGRTAAFLELGDYAKALKDTELLVSVEPENPEIYKLQGITFHHTKQDKLAINALLTALDLDPDNADDITDHIAAVVGRMCQCPFDLAETLHKMDAYKKLSEVGVCLFQSKMYDICIKVLESAQKFQTNQKGITMRVLLTMANAHSCLKHNDKAINLYQECLSTAIATHEQVYQTKALVNIATLYLESGDLYQAIVFYEKLLHLQSEIQEELGIEDESEFPEFWTKELQCGLHLNLSIAYKSIGNIQSAVIHARQYVQLLDKFALTGKVLAESHHNCGMLNEILGNYEEALVSYQIYLKNSKASNDKKGMAQAYGCLGSVYAALRNWKLSVTYHEQYITMATKSCDGKMLSIANEMLGDTFMLKKDFENAIKYYEAMLNACGRSDYRVKATGLCKLGKTYREMKKSQYSIYFYEQAFDLAEDYMYKDIQTLCEYNLACLKQHSTQMIDIEMSRKYFEKLIPYYETKIHEHREEGTHCPHEYHEQLAQCYDGMLCVLAKLGSKEECLQVAEMYKKRFITHKPGYQTSSNLAGYTHHHGPIAELWNVDRMKRVVNQQNSHILYYSLIESHVLLWVIVPGDGVVRFYAGKSQDGTSVIEQVDNLLSEIKSHSICNEKDMIHLCEHRCLPPHDLDLYLSRRKNKRLGPHEDIKDVQNSAINSRQQSSISLKSPFRRLFDMLIAPIEDILIKLDTNSSLIIIPDKQLHHCPFNMLKDWNGKQLHERFHITYLPSILALEKVVHNELDQMKAYDQLNFERNQAKKGGSSKLLSMPLSLTPSSGTVQEESEASQDVIDLRRVSNPRLVTSRPELLSADGRKGLSRENTNMTEELSKKAWLSPRYSTQILPGIPEYPGAPGNKKLKQFPVPIDMNNKVLPPVGQPVPQEHMLSLHSYSSLVSCTSTGTDITTSSMCVTNFAQVSCQDRCLVIGNPQLPECLTLHESLWKPALLQLDMAKQELDAVAKYLDVDPITGHEATKDFFMSEIQKATVIHIATYGCWKEGFIVMTPNPLQLEDGPPKQQSYIVTIEEILSLKLKAQLVVLSMGYSPFRVKDTITPGYEIPSAFLAAGAVNVLVYSWPVPNDAVNKFYFHFYQALQGGSLLSSAVNTAMKQVKEDERYSDPYFWSGFVLIGKDVVVNVKQIRHAMVDQLLDKTEQEMEKVLGKELLHQQPALTKVPDREEHLLKLQILLSALLQQHKEKSDIIPELIDLMDSGLKRLHSEEINQFTTNLSERITTNTKAVELLKALGFHFQFKGPAVTSPYVVYPHWNKDELLVPTYDALRAIKEIAANNTCTQRLCELVPIGQDNISLLIDLMSITKHAPEIQLKVNDLSVRPLWQNSKFKKLLLSIGFHQIGMLLNFNRTPAYKSLLTHVLQFLLSTSAFKSQVLLYRLDVNLLGKPGVNKVIKPAAPAEIGRLPTLSPLLLPRNQLKMSTPWLSKTEKIDEMDEKIKLARSQSSLAEEYHEHSKKAKTWHQITVVAQANETLSKYGRPSSSPKRVKVLPGSSASQERKPVYKEPILVIPQVDQQRDYAQYVLKQRVNNVETRHKNDVLNLYLPYVQTS